MLNRIIFIKETAFLALACLLLLSFQANTASGQELPKLFTRIDNGLAARLLPDLLQDRLQVKIDFSVIRPSRNAPTVIQVTLPGKELLLLGSRTEVRAEDNYTWFGKVDGHELSTAVITVVKGIAFGHVDMDGDTYSIAPDGLGSGVYIIIKTDPRTFIQLLDEARVPPIPKTAKRPGANTTVEDGSRIDVLVLYTQKMLDTYGTGLAAKIQNFVDLANAAYTNSGINTKLRLVNTSLFADTNAAEGVVSIGDTLNYITGAGADGSTYPPSPPAAITALRNSYNADLVSLLRVYDNNGSVCSTSWVMSNVSTSFAPYAFSVVSVDEVSCDNRSFAHELGHNMGCSHDRSDANMSGAFSYSYGYGIDGIFGTVMSYINPRITYFSSPLLTYKGYAIGKDESQPDSADNVKTINNTKATVANFMVSAATGNACSASVSSGLSLHLPVITYANQSYWADLQYQPATSDFTLSAAGLVADASSFSACTAATLSSVFKLHVPAVIINNVSYWLDLQYVSGSRFSVLNYGSN